MLQESKQEPLRWYLLRTKPREEARALENLRNQGFDAFAPFCRTVRRYRGRRVCRTEPLFPGYAFVALNQRTHNWAVIRNTRGVMHLVRFGSEAPVVPPPVIEQLRVSDEVEIRPQTDGLVPGDRVQILEGPLQGLEAALLEFDGQQRAVLLLEWMQRQVKVALERDCLRAA